MNSKRISGLMVTAVSGVIMLSAFAYLQTLFAKCQITAAQYTAAWTSFSSMKIEELNRYLLERNTMGIYIHAHYIDFVFIMSFGVFFYSLFMMISERMTLKGKISAAYRVFAWFAVLESVFDVVETSLVLFSAYNPERIPQWLPYAHDPANIIKFLFFYGVLLWGIAAFFHGSFTLARRGYATLRG